MLQDMSMFNLQPSLTCNAFYLCNGADIVGGLAPRPVSRPSFQSSASEGNVSVSCPSASVICVEADMRPEAIRKMHTFLFSFCDPIFFIYLCFVGILYG